MAPKTRAKKDTFSAEEKAAMRARVREEKRSAGKAEDEAALRESIARMPEDDRS